MCVCIGVERLASISLHEPKFINMRDLDQQGSFAEGAEVRMVASRLAYPLLLAVGFRVTGHCGLNLAHVL